MLKKVSISFQSLDLYSIPTFLEYEKSAISSSIVYPFLWLSKILTAYERTKNNLKLNYLGMNENDG
jgi:hypothetical protein